MYITTQQLKDTAIKNLSNDISELHNFRGESQTILDNSKIEHFERLSHNKAIVEINVIGLAYFQIYVYVNTNVVTKNISSGKYFVNTDGYYTVTTKKLINDVTTLGVYQKDKKWYYSDKKDFSQIEKQYIS